jgi:dGTPase
MTSNFIGKFIKAADRTERSGASSVRYQYQLVVPPRIRTEQLLLNGIVRRLIIESSQVLTLEHKANYILGELFELFQGEKNGERLLPDDRKFDYLNASTHEKRHRVICDYIAGMTDMYAQRTYSRLFQPFAGSVFELL